LYVSLQTPFLGRDNVANIATRYRLDGPGNRARNLPDRPCSPPSLLYNWYRVSFPGVKRPDRGVGHPSQSGAEVKERVELYLYFYHGPSWPLLEWNVTHFLLEVSGVFERSICIWLIANARYIQTGNACFIRYLRKSCLIVYDSR
jgi:hypothetical protein